MTLCPPKLLKLLGFPVICAAMFVVMGGHWAVLQAVALSQMVVSYSQESKSLTVGIQKTFSGQYPCSMCKKIAEAKKDDEQKSQSYKADKKVEVFVSQAALKSLLPVSQRFSYPVTADSRFTSRSDQPPAPVPLLA